MKKIVLILSVLVLAAVLAGCSGTDTAESGDGEIKVYTSFYALYDFAQEIGGDKILLENIVPTGTEPHDWEPSIHDMAKLEDCDILFYNGCGMESWIEKVQSSVSGDITYVELSDGIADDDAADPHIWLSPVNAKLMVQKIAQALCEADAENADYYNQRLSEYEKKLDDLDGSYRQTISDLPNKDIVVSHMAYSYLCSEYGLNQIAVDGINADSEPSPDKMKEIISFINDNGVKYIFYEELLSQKTVQTIADETGAALLPLNPFEGLTDDEIAAGENYISVMMQNLESLKTALGA